MLAATLATSNPLPSPQRLLRPFHHVSRTVKLPGLLRLKRYLCHNGRFRLSPVLPLKDTIGVRACGALSHLPLLHVLGWRRLFDVHPDD